MKRPHIIIVNPDQMRADAMGHLGNPAACTPFLDKMAGEDAVSFRRAFCQNPVCVPSRCSFLTGLYPHVNGHRTMSHLLREHESSLLKELKEQGYYVWMNSRNDLVAGQTPGLFESHATEVYYSGEAEKAPGLEDEKIRGEMGGKQFYSFYGGKLKTDEHGKNYTNDDEDVDAAIYRIRNRKDDRPLCMFLGLMYPHPPYKVEEPYFSAAGDVSQWKRVPAEECAGKPRMEELLREEMNLGLYNDEDWDRLRHCYLGMCGKVDDLFARLCNALKEEGIYDDCAIFFFSDHGDYTGDYGLCEKAQNTFEDCLTNVPLLIKPPADFETDPGVAEGMAELVDVYATVLSFAGAKAGHTHFGNDLRPVLKDREQKGRVYVFSEGGRLKEETHCDEYHECMPNERNYYYPRMKAQTDGVAHGKAAMIRSGRYKYIRRIYEQDELYDLEKDPRERNNLISRPEYREELLKLREAMLDWYQKTADIVPYDYDERFSFEIRWNRVKKICPAEREEEVKEKIRQGANLFEMVHYCESLKKKAEEIL